MQHWGLYQKWNRKLYDEMLAAFHNGRGRKNRDEIWYKGEQALYNDIVISAEATKTMLQNAKDDLRECSETGNKGFSSLEIGLKGKLNFRTLYTYYDCTIESK